MTARLSDDGLTARDRDVIEIAKAFARDRIAPFADRWERDRIVPLDALCAAATSGLVGIMLPEAAGGRGLGHVAAVRALEELAAADFAVAFSLWVHNNLCNAIHRDAKKKLIDRHLPAMLRGEQIGAFCMTEPEVGSDAANLAARTEKTGTGWTIAGEDSVNNSAGPGSA